ncbi:MAG: hypothetical protein OEY59_00730 [Deltaproteobacteria bacterium]|nr:hypothetical protein [Deltaproteobacteria bacterium]
MSKQFTVLILFCAFMVSCQSLSQNLNESISNSGIERLKLEYQIQKAPSLSHEFNELLHQNVAVFSVITAREIPSNLSDELIDIVRQRINQTGFFSKLIGDETIREFFSGNQEANHLKDNYLDSLVTVSVSDKDIINPLGKELQFGNLVVLHMDLWPCPTCKTNDLIRIKVRVVDADSGIIIWTGINEQVINFKEELDLPLISKNLTKGLMTAFYHRFKKKWHKKRYVHLAEN